MKWRILLFVVAATAIATLGEITLAGHPRAPIDISFLTAAVFLALLIYVIVPAARRREPAGYVSARPTRREKTFDSDRPLVAGTIEREGRGTLTFEDRQSDQLSFRLTRGGKTFDFMVRENLGPLTSSNTRYRRYHVENAALVDVEGQRPDLAETLEILWDLRILLAQLLSVEQERFSSPSVVFDKLPFVAPFWASLAYGKNSQGIINRAGARWRTLHPLLGQTPPLWDGYAPLTSSRRSLCRGWLKFSRDGHIYSYVDNMSAAQLELPFKLEDVLGIRAVPGERLEASVELVLRDRTVAVASLITTDQAQQISDLLTEGRNMVLSEIERHGRISPAEHFSRLAAS